MRRAARDALGDRMKSLYELPETSRRFLPMLPVVARMDGRGFSRFTKGMRRPYDPRMTDAMIAATKHLVAHTNARIGFVQSDEISLVYQATDYRGGIFFDGKIAKMTSVLASLATAAFTNAVLSCEDEEFRSYAEKLPHFDARVIQMPSRAEAANMILWRNLDATKNAISMAAHHHFSHKSLQGLGQAAMQERLFQEAGINFNNYPACFKHGTFLRRVTYQRAHTEAELSRIPEGRRPEPGALITRSEVREIEMPIFKKVINRVGVIFDGEDPILATQDADAEAAQGNEEAWQRDGRVEALMALREALRADLVRLRAEELRAEAAAKKSGDFTVRASLHMQANIRRIAYAKVFAALRHEGVDTEW